MLTKRRQPDAPDMDSHAVTPPPLFLALLEAPRALTEASALWPSGRFLRNLEPGDGHAVMTLPGFMASDNSTRTLRRYLRSWGYGAHPWDLGRNFGVRNGEHLDDALDERLLKLYQQSGRKVSLVGWSLGGLLALEAARRNSSIVRSVISLGSPLGDPKATNLWRLYELLTGQQVTSDEVRERILQLRQPIADVPVTAIYSRSDAVVSWKIAQLPDCDMVESIGVDASHLGMGFNPAVLYAIADRLRQVEADWLPFDNSGVRRFFFR
ncbi:lipase family alpha/beta hydrolase [Woeseia oceani]|nr:alpha/beta fold hydrolase [Woeseia oceani]